MEGENLLMSWTRYVLRSLLSLCLVHGVIEEETVDVLWCAVNPRHLVTHTILAVYLFSPVRINSASSELRFK